MRATLSRVTQQVFSVSMLRRDGRTADQLRPLYSAYDSLARSDGSGRFKFGQTCHALASVSGPIEVRLAAELASRLTLEVLVRPLSHVPATESKAFAATIRSILASCIIPSVNPRSLVQIVVQSCSSEIGGSNIEGPHASRPWKWGALAAMINASTLALLNAGSVPLRGVVCAVSVASTKEGLIVDPSDEELSSIHSGGCFAFLFANEAIACVYSSWSPSDLPRPKVNSHEILAGRVLAQSAAVQIYDFIKSKIESGRMRQYFDNEEVDI